MNRLVWIVIILAGYGLLAFCAQRLLYYPMRYPAGNWALQARVGAQDVTLHTQDGVPLHAWWIEKAGAQWVTIHFHGNAGNITHRDLTAQHITDAGSSLLLLDYRGYGKSSGRPTEKGLYSDADAAYRYILSKNWKPQQIILHGESLGTAVAAELATRRQCAGIVLEAPFTSARAVAGKVLPLIGPALVWGYDTQSRIRNLRAPLLIVHGDRDEIIDYSFGQDLYRNAPEPKTFWSIGGATHNDLHVVGGREFSDRLRDFYRTLR